ncbi:peptidyl-prolyl cis-trans isomerase [Mycobacteroides abscessus subsp. abscessus]|nr:peptidyl-prolyl cis-trans isomerase [Mycobacteroides abscessus subsp. abscessus]
MVREERQRHNHAAPQATGVDVRDDVVRNPPRLGSICLVVRSDDAVITEISTVQRYCSAVHTPNAPEAPTPSGSQAVIGVVLLIAGLGLFLAAGTSAPGLVLAAVLTTAAILWFRRSAPISWKAGLGTAAAIGCIPLVIGIFFGTSVLKDPHTAQMILKPLAFFVLSVGAGVVVAVRLDATHRPRVSKPAPVGGPVVVGYTAEGQAVYAPVHSGSQGTNTFAVVALVLGFVGGVLAIPFGHIALSQINRTGEQGRGMAIAGLVLGYLSLAAVAAMIIVMTNGAL